MDVLYIPQLDGDGSGESQTAGRYRLLKRLPEEGAVRDFFVRLVITADEILEVTFAPRSWPFGCPCGRGIFPDGRDDLL